MLLIYQDVVDAVAGFVSKRWSDKEVSCQENEAAWHQNRFIKVTTFLDSTLIHYEYINGFLEVHLEGDYYGDSYCQSLYKFLRTRIDTSDGDYRWHRWYGMTQGRLRWEHPIDNTLELADALTTVIGYIDPILQEFIANESIEENIESELNSSVQSLSLTMSQVLNTTEDTTDFESVVLETLTLGEVMSMNLQIPEYQRVYCWPQKNVEQLLDDIFTPRKHRYHLGTIILQQKGNAYDIIDGQQRLVTLSLILRGLNVTDIKLLNESFDSIEAQKYIGYNRYIIENYLNRFYPNCGQRIEEANKMLELISFDVLVLRDSSLDLAYTFFSTQNARGKALTDYELLKSHHLRYIPENCESQQKHLAKRWDELLISSERESGDKSVSTLLGIYVYCLRKWTRGQYWYIKEHNRVKNEFEAAPTIPEIPAFGERFDFMDPIQGGTHFFAFVDNFIQHYHLFIQTQQYGILWNTISCSGLMNIGNTSEEIHMAEGKKRTHWWYGDVIACFLFAYYLKFGNQYLSEALTCITRIVSQLRYEKSKANKQSIMDRSCELGVIQMINQATSPTFFLAEARNIIKRLPFFDINLTGIRVDFFNKEKDLYEANKHFYHVDFNYLHNHG